MDTEKVLRWVARVWGIVTTLLVLAFVVGGREHIRFKPNEAVGFLFFPVGVITGFAVAWRREGLGGLITLGSLAAFYVWLFARDGQLRAAPYFALLAAPGFLHVGSALIARRKQRAANIAQPAGGPGIPANERPVERL